MRRIASILVLCSLALPALPTLAQGVSPEEHLAAASALFEAKRYDDAAKRLDQFFAAAPNHSKAGIAGIALGKARMELKQYPQAIAGYERAIAGSKDPALKTTAQLGLGEAAMAARQYEKAGSALESAVKGQLKPEQAAYAWYWLGQSHYEQGQFAAAEAAFDRVTREYNKADFLDAAYFQSGLAALKQKKNDAARQRFQTVINNYRKSEDRPQAMLIVAQMDLEAKKYKEARSGFEAMLNDPATKAAGAEIVRAAEDGIIQSMLQAGEYAAAAPYLEKALARIPAADPMRFRAHLSLGHSRYHLKQFDRAWTSYVDAAKSSEGGVAAEAHYWAANSALALKKPQDAAEHFSHVVAKYPKHELAAKAQFRMGESLESAGQIDRAAAAYRGTLDKYGSTPQATEARKALTELVASIDDPKLLATVLSSLPADDRAAGQIRLGKLYITSKAYDQAISAVSPLVKSSAEAAYITGLAYEAQNKTQPAATAFSEAVERGTSAAWAADALTRLAWLYLDLKQAANAESAAAKALGLKPDAKLDQQSRLALMQAQIDQKKWDPALQTAQALKGMNLAPDTLATVLFSEGWILQKGKQAADQALPIWERLSREFPKNNYAADALFYIGEARAKGDKHDEARARYAQILQDFPKHTLATEARFRLGLAYYNLSKFAEAAAELDAVALATDAGDLSPEALYWAGVSLDKAGRKTEAIQRLDRFVTKYSNYSNQERVKNARLRLAALRAVAGGSN